jgi:hypothetical protein
VSMSNATLQSKQVVIDFSNPQEVELALKKVHTYKYVESITLQGETDENTLKKLLYRLSPLNNLSNLTFEYNDFTQLPENIATLKNLTSIHILGNENLDYADFFEKIKSLSITDLYFVDNEWTKAPTNISKVSSLKKLEVSGNTQLNYENLIDQLSPLPQLNTLAIPVNFITDIPKNINKLSRLKVLDVSNNVLTELPNEISSLKAINNLSIQGNLLLNPVKELEKLKDSPIRFLSLDKEISGEELEKIKKIFPDAEVSFPLSTEPETVPSKVLTPEPEQSNGVLKVKKETTVLSTAYLAYADLFRGIRYNFDTLNFEERYGNFNYTGTYQWKESNSAYQYLYLRAGGELPKPYKKEISFRLPQKGTSYPELNAFSGMEWIYAGSLSKKQFKKTYIEGRRKTTIRKNNKTITRLKTQPIPWKDIRIDYDKNNTLFTIELKGDTTYEKILAYPLLLNLTKEKNQQTYNRRCNTYQKTLLRRSKLYNREQLKSKIKYDNTFKERKNTAWKILQTRMSDEEKLMSMAEWLDYYDNLIANESAILAKSSINAPYLLRALGSKKYTVGRAMNTQNGTFVDIDNNRILLATFVNAENKEKLPVSTIYVVNNKTKEIYTYAASFGIAPDVFFLKQFASNTIIVELRNGNFGVVGSKQIDALKLQPNTTYQLEAIPFDKNLDTIETLLKAAEIR